MLRTFVIGLALSLPYCGYEGRLTCGKNRPKADVNGQLSTVVEFPMNLEKTTSFQHDQRHADDGSSGFYIITGMCLLSVHQGLQRKFDAVGHACVRGQIS